MKLQFTLLAGAAVVALCGSAFASPEDVIEQNKCHKCHTATTTKKAPSFASVAEKYKGKPEASAAIVEMLKTGGKDDHQKVAASDADLKAIAATVLSSK